MSASVCERANGRSATQGGEVASPAVVCGGADRSSASPRWRLGLTAAVSMMLALVGCTSMAPDVAGVRTMPQGVVVASFAFSESSLVAEIYAQALEHAGVPVRRERDLGPRELVEPALQQGLVDVVPEYLGTALASVAPESQVDVRDQWAVTSALATAMAQWRLQVLRPARASNTNGIVVTQATATRFALRAVSDLRRVAPQLALAGPPECPTRPYCLLGLRSAYGLRFAHFAPFTTETQRVAALEEAVADVAVLFTTDGRLAGADLLLLRDDARLQPVENLVPVVSERAVQRYGRRVVSALNAVSARLDTPGLVFLNWRVTVAGKPVEGEARGWLRRHGLIPAAAAGPRSWPAPTGTRLGLPPPAAAR